MDETNGTTNVESTPTLADILADKPAAMEHYGLAWNTETVNRETEGNASGTVVATNDAQILSIVDTTAFIAHFPNGDTVLLGIANGTSLRVLAQDVNRRNPSKSREWRRTTIVNRLLGIRNSGTRVVKTITVTVVKNTASLPDGSVYEGTDETEYQQLYLVGLVDAGVPNETARAIAVMQKLVK